MSLFVIALNCSGISKSFVPFAYVPFCNAKFIITSFPVIEIQLSTPCLSFQLFNGIIGIFIVSPNTLNLDHEV